MGLVVQIKNKNMDCRDIKEEPEQVLDGRYFDKIYQLQKVLIDHYVGIEGLPSYPVNINSKKSQNLIKDFVGRVIEELAEGYESLLLVSRLTEKNRLWSWRPNINEDEYELMLSHLQNANEEQVDALHFMVELMIYSNIYPSDVKSFIENNAEINKLVDEMISYVTPEIDRELLDELILFSLAGSVVVSDIFDTGDIRYMGKVDLLGLVEEEDKMDFGLYNFGRYYNKQNIEDHAKYIWCVTYHLNLARNSLKNKPWKQSQMITDELIYQSEIVKAFLCLVAYYFTFGFRSSEMLYYLYFKKNKINQFRIRSNY